MSLDRSVWTRFSNLFLLAIPAVLFLSVYQSASSLVLALSGLALIPLSGFIESAVEELAELLGPFLGGLLHTTFGNLGELSVGLAILIVSPNSFSQVAIPALIAGFILRNTLLFPGIAILLRSLKNGRMRFDVESASAYTSVLLLAVVLVIAPSIATAVGDVQGVNLRLLESPLPFTLAVAVILLLTYLTYVAVAVFQIGRYRAPSRQRGQMRSRRMREGMQEGMREGMRSPSETVADSLDIGALFAEERAAAEDLIRREDGNRRGESIVAEAVGSLSGIQWRLLGLLLSPDRHPMLFLDSELSRRADKARFLVEQVAASPSGGVGAMPGVLPSTLPSTASPTSAAAAAVLARRRAREERGQVGYWAENRILRALIAVVILAVAAAGIEVMAIHLVTAMNAILQQAPYERVLTFLAGFLVLPLIVGYVDLYGVVDLARRNLLEITLAVSGGATIQFLCVVVPVLLLVGITAGFPLALVIPPMAAIAAGVAALILILITRNGEATWFLGFQLIGVWIILVGTAILTAAR